jgi:hypothetical protein
MGNTYHARSHRKPVSVSVAETTPMPPQLFTGYTVRDVIVVDDMVGFFRGSQNPRRRVTSARPRLRGTAQAGHEKPPPSRQVSSRFD